MVRVKWRYVLTRIVTGPNLHEESLDFSEKAVINSVKTSFESLHGAARLALIVGGLKVKYINTKTLVVLIRVYRASCQQLLQALALVTRIGGENVFFSTLHVSGTIRSCYKFLLSNARTDLLRVYHAMETSAGERELISKSLGTRKKKMTSKMKKAKRKQKELNTT